MAHQITEDNISTPHTILATNATSKIWLDLVPFRSHEVTAFAKPFINPAALHGRLAARQIIYRHVYL